MIELNKIHLEYNRVLLDDEQMMIPTSKITLITGESGSGKTALLYRIGLITVDCQITYDDIRICQDNVTQMRRDAVGFVLHYCDLIDHLSVRDNLIHYALMINHHLDDQEIKAMLSSVQLDVSLDQECLTLSLGQRQRLALACTLIKDPAVLVLDEPTASLDEENERIVFEILTDLAHNKNKTIVIASHSEMAFEYADQIYEIADQHLNLIKETTYQKTNEIIESKEIDPRFYRTYVFHHYQKYKPQYILLSLVLFVIMILNCAAFSITEYIVSYNKDLLYSSFDKLLYVTEDQSSFYPKDNFGLYDLPTLKDYEHPYIKMTLANDDSIYIVPYFDSQDLDDRLLVDNHLGHPHGIYISQNIRDDLWKYYGDLSIDITLVVNVFEDYNFIEKSIETTVLGFIKPNVKEFYNNRNDKYIYMYYQDMEKLYDGNQYVGFVAEFENYQQLKQAKQQYENQGYLVNDTFIDIESIDEIVSYYTKLENTIIISLFIIATIIIVLINLNLYFRRKRELAILLVNGLSIKMLVKITGYEYIRAIKYPLIIYMIIQIPLLFLFNSNYMILLYPVMFITISFVFVLAISYLLNKHLKIEKVLRDS